MKETCAFGSQQYSNIDSLELLQLENFSEELVHERRLEVNKSSGEIDFNNLTCYYTSKSAPKYFTRFKVPLYTYHDLNEWLKKLTERKKFKKILIRAK